MARPSRCADPTPRTSPSLPAGPVTCNTAELSTTSSKPSAAPETTSASTGHGPGDPPAGEDPAPPHPRGRHRPRKWRLSLRGKRDTCASVSVLPGAVCHKPRSVPVPVGCVWHEPRTRGGQSVRGGLGGRVRRAGKVLQTHYGLDGQPAVWPGVCRVGAALLACPERAGRCSCHGCPTGTADRDPPGGRLNVSREHPGSRERKGCQDAPDLPASPYPPRSSGSPGHQRPRRPRCPHPHHRVRPALPAPARRTSVAASMPRPARMGVRILGVARPGGVSEQVQK